MGPDWKLLVFTQVIKSGWSLLKKDAGFHSSELPSSQCIKPSAGSENEDFETPSFPIFYRSLLPPDRNDLVSCREKWDTGGICCNGSIRLQTTLF